VFQSAKSHQALTCTGNKSVRLFWKKCCSNWSLQFNLNYVPCA